MLPRALPLVLALGACSAPAPVPTHAISGTVRGFQPAGVTVTLAGPGAGAATTGASGAYRLEGLPAGTYTLTPARAGSTFTPASLQVTLAGADAVGQDFQARSAACAPPPAGAPAGERWARERTTDDQPDDFPGEYQVHVLLVEPFDRTATPGPDVSGALRRSVAAFTAWLKLQTGGPVLRLDTCGGDLDVTHVKLGPGFTEVALAEGLGLSPPGPLYLRDRLEAELRPRFADPHKLYLVYYDGLAFQRCGGAPYPPSLLGRFPAMTLGGLFALDFLTQAAAAGQSQLTVHSTAELPLGSPPFPATVGSEAVTVTAVAATSLTLAQPLAAAHPLGELVRASTTIPDCRANPFSSDGQALGYLDLSALHELVHALGMVSPAAADFAAAPVAPGHLGDGNPAGGADLMYQGAQPWTCSWQSASAAASPCRLDPGHRNYFGLPATSAAVDLARSAFLTPTPASPVLPAGW